MRDTRRTMAAFWRAGMKQKLIVDLFDAHKELEKTTKADDADDIDLTPFWALKTKMVE